MSDYVDLEHEIGPGDDRQETEDADQRATAVVVAGMHRSGTSALVRVLNLLGLDLPQTLYPARSDNPLGYWEPLPVVEAHEEFLTAVGSSFDDFFALGEGSLRGSAAQALEDKLVDLLDQEYGASRQFVVKDPRICRLIPIWTTALARFGAAPRFVLPVRNPLEVAASLKLRNEYGTTKSLLLWLRHVLEAEQHTRGLRRSVVSYEQLLRDWRGVVGKVSHELGLVWPRASHAAHAEIEQFLSPRRRHHAFAADELGARPDVVDWVKTTYEILLATAEGEQLEQDVLDAVRGELDRADRAFGPLLAELSLAQRAQDAAAESRAGELDERTRALANATAEMERLTTELAGSQEALVVAAGEATASREQVGQLQVTLGERKQALEEGSAEIARLTVELAEQQEALSASAAQAAIFRDQVERLRSELVERERATENAGANVLRLTSELERQQDVVAAAVAEAADARAEVERLEAELAQREHALTEAHAEVAGLTAELAERQETVRIASAEAGSLRTQIEQSQAELAQRDEALTAAAAEAATSCEQIDRLRGDLAEREDALEDARSDVVRLTSELAQRDEALATAAAEAAISREHVDRLRDDLAERKHALEQSRSDVTRLTAELAQREGALAAAASQAAISHEQVARLQAELTQRETALSLAHAENTRMTDDLARRDDERAQTQEIIRALEERVEALGDVAAAQEARAQRALNQVADLRAGLVSRGERLAKLQTVLTESRRQRREVLRELRTRADVLSAAAAENDRLRAEGEELRGAITERESQLSRLDAERVELDAAVTSLRRETERNTEELGARSKEVRRGEALAAELRERVAELELSQESARNELGEAEAALELSRADIGRLTAVVADREASLTRFTTRRFVRPRTRRRAASQLLSWLVRPHRGGWRFVREWRRLRRAGSFSVDAYLAENPDVDASGLDPLMHYIEHGAYEGRALAPAPAPLLPTVAEPVHAVAAPRVAAPSPMAPPLDARPLVVVKPRTPTPPPDPQAPADFSDFIVLLSRQRSGTNPLRSILETHPDVFCFNEVFNLPDKDSDEPLLRESNFFTFLERYGRDDIRRTMPDYHERLFLDYLEYLRCISEKRYALIDVKYNNTHFLSGPWQDVGSPSYLFELIAKHGLYVLNVTRRNYLRYLLSAEKAYYSKRFTVEHGDAAYVDEKLRLDPDYALSELARCREEDERIQREMRAGDRVLAYDYADIFPGNGVVISPEFLERFAEWRGIAKNQFVVAPEYRKQSTLPLHETVANYNALAAALRGGPFEYCLEDEPSYRAAERLPAKAASNGGLSRSSYDNSDRDDWREVIGSDPDSFSGELCRTRPRWITGSLSWDDARFLFQQALTAESDEAVEIGTASGFSTTVLAHAFHFRAVAGRVTDEWRVRSYDILEHLYYDDDRRVGDAAREMLPGELLAHVQFNSPATALDVGERHAADSIRFLFIDANHQHPWPALDLLAVLDVLRVGAIVLLHDVNLPLIHPEFPAWGVNHVFTELELEKLVPDVELPNIAAFAIPEDKELLRHELLTVVDGHPWEVEVPDDVIRRVIPGHAVGPRR